MYIDIYGFVMNIFANKLKGCIKSSILRILVAMTNLTEYSELCLIKYLIIFLSE